jgi:hypothetical protein
MIVRPVSTAWTRLLSFVLSLAVVVFAVAPALATSIQTDLWVYQYGDTVNVTGDGFGVTEAVDVVTTDPYGVEVDHGTTQSDDAGYIAYSFTLTSDLPGIYDVVATGLVSGLTASTQFDPSAVTVTAPAAFLWYRTLAIMGPDGFDVTVSGTYTCAAGNGGGGNCTTAQSVDVEIRTTDSTNNQATGSLVASTTISSLSGNTWTTTFLFRESGPNFPIPSDQKYDVRAVFHYLNGTTATTKEAVRDDYLGVDNTQPLSAVTSVDPNAGPGGSTSKLQAAGTASDATSGLAGNNVLIELRSGSASGSVLASESRSVSSGTWTYANNSPPQANGTYCVTSTASDNAGNVQSPIGSMCYTLGPTDTTPPGVSMSSAALNPTNASPIAVSVAFSEAVSGFTSGDISAGNGTVGNFQTVNSSNYTFDLTPSGQGLVTANIAAGVAQDLAGNNNTAAAQFSRTYDSVTSKPTLLSPANGSATNDTTPTFDWTDVVDTNSPVSYTLQYVAKGGTCDFTGLSVVTQGGLAISTSTPVSSIGSDGTYCWRVKAIDNLGNDSGYTSAFEFVLDTAKPVISTSAHNADSSAYVAGTWTHQSVTVSFSCADGSGSGLATNTTAGDGGTLSSETSSGSFTSLGSHCVDNAGNAAVTNIFSPIKIDKTAPVISASAHNADSSAYVAGTWTHQSVTVSFSCAEAGSVQSGIATNLTGSDGGTQSAETSAGGFSSPANHCVDAAGNEANPNTFGLIKIDKTAPVISASAHNADSSAYVADTWTHQSVTVSFSCAEAGLVQSGIATDQTGTDGGTQSAETSAGTFSSLGSQCVDNAGNAAVTNTFSPIKVDKTAPVISASAHNGDSSAYVAGTWTHQDVTVSFSCSESGGSGFATNTTAGDGGTLSSETSSGSFTSLGSHCVDNAGNAAVDNTFSPIKIDKTAPVIANEGPTTSPNGAGWYKADVINQFSVSDSLSGIDATCDAAFNLASDWQSKTTSGEGLTVHVSSDGCSDVAGNSAPGINSANFKIDKTNPLVAITSPTNGSSTIALTISVSGTTSDALSGLASVKVNGISAVFGSGTFGAMPVPLACGLNTITATATDLADRAASSSITVTRTCFGNLQFYAPIDQSTGTPVVNSGKYGRVIPTKVTFALADGTVVTDTVMLANGWTLQMGVGGATCSNGNAIDPVELYADAGQSSAGTNLFRWSSGQWIYNLDTNSPPGMTMAIGNCYRLDVYVYDGFNKIKISTGPGTGTNPYALFKPTK